MSSLYRHSSQQTGVAPKLYIPAAPVLSLFRCSWSDQTRLAVLFWPINSLSLRKRGLDARHAF